MSSNNELRLAVYGCLFPVMAMFIALWGAVIIDELNAEVVDRSYICHLREELDWSYMDPDFTEVLEYRKIRTCLPTWKLQKYGIPKGF